MKIIKIKDYYGTIQEVPVSDELYAEWIKLNNETQEHYHREKYHRIRIRSEGEDRCPWNCCRSDA